jgi:hypothetical protein
MADLLFNIARGRDVQFAINVNTNTPANSAIGVLLLKVVEANDALADHATVAAMLAAAGNTEADATNYTRITLTDTDGIAVTVSNGSNNVTVDCGDLLFASLGGGTNNTIHKAVFFYIPDTTSSADADCIPMYAKDVLNQAGDATGRDTNGQNFTLGTPNGLITQ